MGKFFKTLREQWKLLGTSIYTGKRLEENLMALSWSGLIVALVGLVTTIVNLATHRGLATWATFAILLIGIAVWYSARFMKNRKLCIVLVMIICIVFFTLFAVMGVNNGFAITWTILVPMAVGYYISVKLGILLGIYYELLYITLFYTPLRSTMSAYYSDTLMTRFPILYLCAIALSSVAIMQLHFMTLKQLDYESNLEKEVEIRTRDLAAAEEKLSRLNVQIVEALANAIDAKDEYTKGHSTRVAYYSRLIGEALGMDEDQLQDLQIEALLHDIGKIGITDDILNKPGKLLDEEYEVIKSHTTIGEEILSDIETLPEAATVARYHHEHYDGSGYPEGLSGKDIPLHARIVSVADAYDAMHSDRIYRKRLPDDKIRSELRDGRGKQFDNDCADAILELMDRGVLKKLN